MQRDPPPFIWAAPDEKNILTCASGDFVALKRGVLTRITCYRELSYRMKVYPFPRDAH